MDMPMLPWHVVRVLNCELRKRIVLAAATMMLIKATVLGSMWQVT